MEQVDHNNSSVPSQVCLRACVIIIQSQTYGWPLGFDHLYWKCQISCNFSKIFVFSDCVFHLRLAISEEEASTILLHSVFSETLAWCHRAMPCLTVDYVCIKPALWGLRLSNVHVLHTATSNLERDKTEWGWGVLPLHMYINHAHAHIRPQTCTQVTTLEEISQPICSQSKVQFPQYSFRG